jgi:acyl-CoA thioesterase I
VLEYRHLRPLSYALTALFVYSLAACSAQQPDEGNAQAPAAEQAPAGNAADGKLVLAFGDSLYAGYGLDPGQSFPARLDRALDARGIPVTVHNAGVSGDTTADGLRRLDFTLDGLPRKPDLAIVGLGGNDMLRGLAPAEAKANLEAICDKLRSRGIAVMLTGMVAAPNLGSDYGEEFNAIYPALAEHCDAPLYPFFLDGVVGSPELMLADRIHPSAAGVDRVVERIAPLVAKQLDPAGG